MNKHIAIVLLFVAVVSSGCATAPRVWITPEHDKGIAAEFVEWMTVDENFPFDSTTIQIRRGQGVFGDTLKDNMRSTGFFIQTIPDHFVAPNLISYEAMFVEGGKGRAVIYTVRVGKNEVSRKYRHKGFSGKWKPESDFEVIAVEQLEKPREDELIAGTVSTIPVSEVRQLKPVAPKRQLIPGNSLLEKEYKMINSGNDFAASIQKRLAQLESEALSTPAIEIAASYTNNGTESIAMEGEKDPSMLAMEQQMFGTAKPKAVSAVNPVNVEATAQAPVKLYRTASDEPLLIDEPGVIKEPVVVKEVPQIASTQQGMSTEPEPPLTNAGVIDKPLLDEKTPVNNRRINLLGFNLPTVENRIVPGIAAVKIQNDEANEINEPGSVAENKLLAGKSDVLPVQKRVEPHLRKRKQGEINLLGF